MTIELLTPRQAHDAVTAIEGDAKPLILDVRTEGEFHAGHPQGALNVPAFVPGIFGKQLNEAFVEVVEANVAVERPVYCLCAAGVRSQFAAELLAQAGYRHVANILAGYEGGYSPSGEWIEGWLAGGLPVCHEPPPDACYPVLRARSRR